MRTTRAWTALRRVVGPTADQLHVLCQPIHDGADAARQAEAVYEALLDALAAEHAGPETLVAETVFFGRIQDDLAAVRTARSRVLGSAGLPATTCIGQPPLSGAHLELAALAVVPRPEASWSADDVTRPAACTCEACAPGLRARVVRVGEQTSLRAGNVYGSGHDPVEAAYDMFRAAEGLLAEAGMAFGDVLSTRIHVRDIDRDYAALNEARRRFFRDRGIERRPASTGVQGIPFPPAHDFSMSLYALRAPRPLDVVVMSTPSLSEAWSYGSEFSRGLRLGSATGATLFVSGTASIDEAGRTAHVGDFEAQVDRMLHNVAALLARQGADFRHLVSGVTYVKRWSDAPMLRAMLRKRGFDGFPLALVEAPLCRPELLCETEAVASLPLGTPAA
jgi:enamine deaminase RidA (YjgF/YER057c/UK114 family)